MPEGGSGRTLLLGADRSLLKRSTGLQQSCVQTADNQKQQESPDRNTVSQRFYRASAAALVPHHREHGSSQADHHCQKENQDYGFREH